MDELSAVRKQKSNVICDTCTKACGRCSWSRDLTPVAGWTATEVPWFDSEIKGETTYQIKACPEYELDPKRKRQYKSDRVRNTVPIRCQATSLETGEVKVYPSVSATKHDGFKVSSVYEVIIGNCSQHKGWKFEKVEVMQHV